MGVPQMAIFWTNGDIDVVNANRVERVGSMVNDRGAMLHVKRGADTVLFAPAEEIRMVRKVETEEQIKARQDFEVEFQSWLDSVQKKP